jgi:hypothetical protein
MRQKEVIMPKKIKSFTVDEEVYNSLVAIFKRYKTGVSISLYVNKMLKRLLADLKETEDGLKNSSVTVPMDYIINKIVTGVGEEKPKYPDGWEGYVKENENPVTEEDMKEMNLLQELEDWQVTYDAEQKGIPYELYKYTVSGAFVLSNDKKYLINKQTGEKFFPVNGTLMKLVDKEK